MEVELIPVDPAQNHTLFVMTPVEPSLRPRVASALMARQDPPVEQVAFVTADAPLPHMEMMGGEFCGNASRSFGMLVAKEKGLQAGKITVVVSGCTHPLEVEFDLNTNTAWVEMPLHKALHRLDVDGISVPVLEFEGLCHAVLDCDPDADLAQKVIRNIMSNISADAVGVIFLRQEPLYITPVVYVPATGSTVWERSCGSGSLAAALWLALCRPENGLQHYCFAQPGGMLEIDLELVEGRAAAARLGGPVFVGQPQTISLTL